MSLEYTITTAPLERFLPLVCPFCACQLLIRPASDVARPFDVSLSAVLDAVVVATEALASARQTLEAAVER